MQENTDRQLNEIGNTVKEQNEHFTKDTEILKQNQTEIVHIKNSIKEVKNTIASIGIRAARWGKGSVTLKIEIWK